MCCDNSITDQEKNYTWKKKSFKTDRNKVYSKKTKEE
jgi:hypothetical protein